MTTPADEMREAAQTIRKLITALPAEHWGNRPWQAEECSDTDDMTPCPCIVSQGEYREFDQPQIPPIQYVADAETPEFATYIAAMHPGVGTALADWLDAEAATWAGDEDHNRCTPQTCTSEAALAVARAITTHTTA
ncbi:hypothetical protein AB0F30_16775 [Streptomyces sp. NPDC029006]|uniref:hypothetical protein n=1 Tax=Streptomyces sp. NPDC029006 TaxID=3155467 RepID=UPI0033D377FE